MSAASRQHLLPILIVLAVAAMLITVWWIRQGSPVELVAAPGGRVQCVSYAPSSRRDETLLDQGVIVPAERIERDLELLAQRFDCVRTYSQSNGLAEVPRIAHQMGLKVLMGVWLGRDPVINQREIESALHVASRDREAIIGIVVGNEVLLRGELAPEVLRGHIERVRAATDIPVTYADVWEFWRRYRSSLEDAVDFVTFHILPYWEDEPVSVAQAVAHIRDVYNLMQAEFPGRELLIGETGWPSAGRQRRGALPGVVNQARFIRELLAFTTDAGIRYNIIEAFDQPWKRRQEGAVGGYWGLHDHERQEKFPLQGSVIEEPHWYWALVSGVAIGLLFWFATRIGGVALHAPQVALLVLAGYVTGCVLAEQVKNMWLASRSVFEWTIALVWTGLALGTVWWQARALTQDASAGNDPGWRRLRFIWLYSATIVSLLLVLDSRYRDFPIALFGLPIAGFALFVLRGTYRTVPAIEERLMAGWLIVAALVTPFLEGVQNLYALAWAGLCGLFGVLVLAPARGARMA